MRVIIMTQSFQGNSARILDYLLSSSRFDDLEIVGVLFDEGKSIDRKRQKKRLEVWYNQGGVGYLIWRLWLVTRLTFLKCADYKYNIFEMSQIHSLEFQKVPNVNSLESKKFLRRLSPDIGLSLGNRIISRNIFSMMPLGILNLHHGMIPYYRGGPPCFWELFNGEKFLGVSVHRIDSRLDHGDLLSQGMVKIDVDDDTETLFSKALTIDCQIVTDALIKVSRGEATPIPVDYSLGKVYTLPSIHQVKVLEKTKNKRIDPYGYLKANLNVFPNEDTER